MNQEIKNKLSDLGIEFEENKSLANYTTWKIGGPAEILIEANSKDQLIRTHEVCEAHGVSLTILGGGSDVLISDSGIHGVVVINKAKDIEILDAKTHDSLNTQEAQEYSMWRDAKVDHRHGEAGSDFYTFEDLDYNETGPTTLVRFDSGVVLSYAIAYTIKNGLTGLQWFAGIPGTMGGALYNNVHGGTKHLSDNFVQSTIIDEQGIRQVGLDYFEFGYDQSALRHKKGVIVLDVTMSLFNDSDVDKAKFVAREWARRKRIQPRVSAGCVFQNILPLDQLQHNLPSPSVGYMVDKVFNWSGKREGGAMISDKHSAFIENIDNATARDVLILIKAIKSEARQRFDINLIPEINLLGFEESEISDIID